MSLPASNERTTKSPPLSSCFTHALVFLVRSKSPKYTPSFIVIMPLTFVSNAFVPSESFSGVLKALVEWNPVSAVTQAARDLFGNTPDGYRVPDAWSLQHPVLYTLAWIALILLVFVPLSVRQYRLASSK